MPKRSQPPLPKTEEAPPNRELIIPPLKLDCTYDPNRTRNGLFMKIVDTQSKVFVQNDDGTEEELGSVAGCLGGTIVIQDRRTKEEWRLRPLDLWRAYQESRQSSEN
jgi:hypothetical protein